MENKMNMRPKYVVRVKKVDQDTLALTEKNVIIVGSEEEYLYCVEVSANKESNNFIKCNNSNTIQCNYYCNNKIEKVLKYDVLSWIAKENDEAFREIVRGIIKNNKNSLECIDLAALNIPISDDCVLYMEGELYITLQKTSEDTYKIARLKEDKVAKYGFKIRGSKYVLDKESIFDIDIYDDGYFVLYKSQGIANNLVKNSDMKNKDKNKVLQDYKFGDVIVLKKNNERVIYVTEKNAIVYYVTFDQMDFFTGFHKIDKNNVSELYRKLDQKEIERLATRIERPLTNGKYPVYSEIKHNVLESIKSIKNNG